MEEPKKDASRAHEDLETLAREAEKSRKALEDRPPPGTDPLHEGP